MNAFKSILAAAALTSLGVPAAAQMVEADHDEVSAALEAGGYPAEILGSGGARFIGSDYEGAKFGVIFFGCDDEGDGCKSVMLFSRFTNDTGISKEQMNDYAADNRWARFYVDGDGDLVMEQDVDLEDGGMSQELFIDNVQYFVAAMVKFIGWAGEQ